MNDKPIEAVFREIDRALRAIDADGETVPGHWDIHALPMCSVDVDFIRACSPDNIRVLLRLAHLSHRLAWDLAGITDALAAIDDLGTHALQSIDFADRSLEQYRGCYGPTSLREHPKMTEDSIMEIHDQIVRGIGLDRKAWQRAPIQFARAIEAEIWNPTSKSSPDLFPSGPHEAAEARPEHHDSGPHPATPGTTTQPIAQHRPL